MKRKNVYFRNDSGESLYPIFILQINVRNVSLYYFIFNSYLSNS